MKWLCLCAVLCAACSDSGSATLRVRVQAGPGVTAPAYVSVSAYAARTQFLSRRLDPPLPADTVEPVTDFTPWRIFAWAHAAGQDAPIAYGTAEAHPASSGETMALVTLGSDLPPDSDGDGVPDAYDDCPRAPDPKQDGNCSIDAGATADGPPPPMDAGRDAVLGPNLIMNPGCENGTAGWGTWHATLTQSPIAHTGNFSCMVCLNAGFTNYTIDDDPNTVSMPLSGQLYVGSAYVRALPNAVDTQMVSMTLREHTTQGVTGPETSGNPVTLDQTWKQVTSAHMLNMNAYDLDIYVGGAGQAGDCFLIDDIVLLRAL